MKLLIRFQGLFLLRTSAMIKKFVIALGLASVFLKSLCGVWGRWLHLVVILLLLLHTVIVRSQNQPLIALLTTVADLRNK